jgi:hypothetical protein
MTRTLQLFFCLIVLSSSAAFAASPVAYVYVAEDASIVDQYYFSNSPITIFSAASNGKLTQIKGSPFKGIAGQLLVGTNGTHFITVDYDSPTNNPYLYSYDVASNGVIGKQVSKVDLHQWCRYNDGAELDHTGQSVYVSDGDECGGGLQTFSLSKTGELSFKGSLPEQHSSLPTLSGNNKFGYPIYDTESDDSGCYIPGVLGMVRESNGVLQRIAFSQTDPIPPSGFSYYLEGGITDDPTNHLALSVYTDDGACNYDGTTGVQIASYTIGSQGDLVSTNNWQDMPTVAAGYVNFMKLNPSGNILAVAAGTGIQFFHFNGANPPTAFTGIIGISGSILTMAWDKDNHLYAINGASGRLHVYTATATTVVETPGSPYENIPYCTAGNCPVTLVVRSVP